jgi:hypothetical protein
LRLFQNAIFQSLNSVKKAVTKEGINVPIVSNGQDAVEACGNAPNMAFYRFTGFHIKMFLGYSRMLLLVKLLTWSELLTQMLRGVRWYEIIRI